MQQRKFKLATLVLLILAVALLTACGGGAPATEEANTATIEVVEHDIYYGDSPDNQENPPVWTVPAGAEVTIDITNTGALEHNWAVVEPGAEVPVPYDPAADSGIIMYDTGLIDPNSSSTAVFTAPVEPGEYTVICTVAGHYPGMQGRLVVTE